MSEIIFGGGRGGGKVAASRRALQLADRHRPEVLIVDEARSIPAALLDKVRAAESARMDQMSIGAVFVVPPIEPLHSRVHQILHRGRGDRLVLAALQLKAAQLRAAMPVTGVAIALEEASFRWKQHRCSAFTPCEACRSIIDWKAST